MTNNNAGVAGISWYAKIMPVRISGPSGFVTDATIGDAINFAQANGAKILNCSWGGGPPSTDITTAIDKAIDKGCLIVASAGNAIPSADVFFPARYPKCIAVGALMHNDDLWNYSCHGPGKEVDLVAPSGDVNLQGDIYTTDQSGANGYNTKQPGSEDPTGDVTGHFGGTSAAAPIVSGCLALCWSLAPDKPAAAIREALESTAIKIDPTFGGWAGGRSNMYGFGKVNPLKAMGTIVALERNSAVKIADTNGNSNSTRGVLVDAPRRSHDVTSSQDRSERLWNHLQSPKPAKYTVEAAKSEIGLTADRDHEVALFVPRTLGQDQQSALWSKVLKSGVKPGKPLFYPDANTAVYVVPADSLAGPKQLLAAADEQNLLWATPVYNSSDGTKIIPLRSIVVKPASPDSREQILNFAREENLGVLDTSDDAVKLQMGLHSTDSNVFDYVKSLEDLPSVHSAEPAISRQLKKF